MVVKNINKQQDRITTIEVKMLLMEGGWRLRWTLLLGVGGHWFCFLCWVHVVVVCLCLWVKPLLCYKYEEKLIFS